MENYHKHTYGSNISTPDSTVSIEDYAKRAVELGQKSICSVEHGWQGKYHEYYEIAQKYGLKFIFGTEAYWVMDRHSTDKSNCHIIILAKNEDGRQEINEILSTANEDGYYYKPRIDPELIFELSPKNVFVTSACVAFWKYDRIEDFVKQLHDYFGENFMLEIQNHNTEKQIELNQRIKTLADKYGIELIAGLDSHYIYPEQARDRDEYLKSKGLHYEDEDGWYMDYPDEQTTLNRFMEQGIWNEKEVLRAIDNSNIVLGFEDYDSEVFKKNRKLPTLYPGKTQEEKNLIYGRLITRLFKEYTDGMSPEEYQKYFEGVKMEVDTYKETGMVDYPLLDYAIVKRGLEKGGIITATGRGSAVGYFTNTLCGFSKVDRFKAPIKLYPERFISKTRILETNSLPDIDMNISAQEPFEEAQTEILGRDHAYPMIAFGTLKKKAAFKMYARAQNMDFDLANKISNQLSQYDEAMKNASDEEREDIDIYDYVSPEYKEYVERSKSYWGIIDSKSKAPCAYLLYQGSIRRQIGLIKCKSESTKREYITTVVDGAVAENYKFLKNDWLIVETVLLTDLVFKRIGMKPMTVNQLTEAVKDDKKVWWVYANGYTVGVNQCEKPNAMNRLKRYKPRNISELAAFIAGIRPGFKSMYSKFESREPFSYGIPVFDNLIQTPEVPYSFVEYQEQVMSVLNFAGFPMDECYGIIKAIAKKHPEKVKPLKSRFIEGFKEKIKGQCPPGQTEDEAANKVWKIIEDNCGYGFNSSHALCMAYDSLYNAWQKANHPYEFYEVLLQHFSSKGKKDKVAILKQEMKEAFGIEEGPMKWGLDNRDFKADPEHHCINPALVSIKGISKTCASELYRLSKSKKFKSFVAVVSAIKSRTRVNSGQLETLIKLDYFSDFGNPNQLLEQMKILDKYNDRTDLFKSDIEGIIPHDLMVGMCEKETEKKYCTIKNRAIIDYLISKTIDVKTPITDRIQYEADNLGYIQLTMPNLKPIYIYVLDIDGKFANKTVSAYVLKTGQQRRLKVKGRTLEAAPIEKGDILRIDEERDEGRWSKDEQGQWIQSKTDKETILRKYVHVR
jgi:DNA polymerase III alpha subunit